MRIDARDTEVTSWVSLIPPLEFYQPPVNVGKTGIPSWESNLLVDRKCMEQARAFSNKQSNFLGNKEITMNPFG